VVACLGTLRRGRDAPCCPARKESGGVKEGKGGRERGARGEFPAKPFEGFFSYFFHSSPTLRPLSSVHSQLNFPLAAYAELLTILPTMSEDEVMAMLRVSARPAGGGPRAPPRPVGAGAAGGGRAPPKAPGVAAGGVAKKVVKKVAKKAAAAVAAPAGPPTRKVTRAQAAAEAAALAATAAATPTPTPTPAARPCGGNGGRGASAAPSLLPSMTPHRTPQPLLIPSAAPPATPWWQAPSLCELEGVVGGGGGGGVAPAADGAAVAALADMYMALTGTPGWRM